MRSLRLPAYLLALLLALPPPAAAGALPDTEFDAFVHERATHHGLTVEGYLDALRTQEELKSVVSAVRADPQRFGGVYWDWAAATPGFVVQYTGAHAPDWGANVKYVRVERSRAELESILEELDALTDAAGDPRLSGWVRIGIDEIDNTVRVVLTSTTAPLRSRLVGYGDGVSLAYDGVPAEPALCLTRTDCTYFRGGIQIVGDEFNCSYGLNARRWGTLYMVTSGHCDWDLDSTWYHNNTQGHSTRVGISLENGLHNGADIDVLRSSASGQEARYPYNLVYSADVNKGQAITGVIEYDNQFFGMDLRRAGFVSSKNGEVCGATKFKYWMTIHGWPRSAWGLCSTATAEQGNSGGPVWHYHSSGRAKLMGFVSLTDGTYALQDDAARVLGIDKFCTDNDC